MKLLRRSAVSSVEQDFEGIEAHPRGFAFVQRYAMQQLRVSRTILAAQCPETLSLLTTGTFVGIRCLNLYYSRANEQILIGNLSIS